MSKLRFLFYSKVDNKLKIQILVFKPLKKIVIFTWTITDVQNH